MPKIIKRLDSTGTYRYYKINPKGKLTRIPKPNTKRTKPRTNTSFG